jgi:hypothetical protein
VPDQGGVRFVSGVNATASWGLHEELSNDATTTTEHEGPSNDVKTSSEGDSLDSTTTTTSTGSNDGYSNPKSEGSSRTSTVRSSTAKIGQGRTPSVVMVTIRPHVTNATRWWPEVGQRVSIVPTSGVGAVYQRGGLGGVVVEDLTVHGSGNDAIHECVVVFHTSSSSSTHLSRLLLRAYTWLVVSQPSCTARVNRLSLILHLQHASFSPRTHTHAWTPPPPPIHPPHIHARTTTNIAHQHAHVDTHVNHQGISVREAPTTATFTWYGDRWARSHPTSPTRVLGHTYREQWRNLCTLRISVGW